VRIRPQLQFPTQRKPTRSPPPPGGLVDWDDAPEVASFYGRDDELALLADWLTDQRCRVLSVLGIGGIGKSALAVTLMHRVAGEFDAVIWRSLQDAPPCESLLDGILGVLAGESLITVHDTLERRLNLLFEFLRTRRVLLVLDNLESVMEGAEGSGRMLPAYEGYGRLMRRAAETRHKSALLLTSREKPVELAPLEGSRSPVRSIHLGQLDPDACEAILREREVTGSAAQLRRLVEYYSGNPLALKIVAPTIASLFDGEIAAFLEQGELIFGSVRILLREQFERLSAVEESILLWLAIMREPATVQDLAAALVNPLPRAQVLEALDTLRGRSLIEHGKSKAGFTLQSVVLEYTTAHLIEAAVSEIENGQLRVLVEHRLLLAGAKEYLWQAQARLIVAAILARLRAAYPDPAALETHLVGLLEPLRGQSEEHQGYAPANLLTLLRFLRGDLSGLDLHDLLIRWANLQGVTMRDTTLAGSTLRNTWFTEAFADVWSIVVSENGTYWVAGDRQGKVWVWSSREERLHLVWQAHHYNVSALGISVDEQRIATGSWGGLVKVWDSADGALLWTSFAVNAVIALAFSPDGRVLAVGDTGGQIRILDAADGTLLQTLGDAASPIFCVAWHPDGTALAGAGHDAQIRIYEPAEDASGPFKPEPARRLSAHSEPVTGLAFSPDGRTLASVSWDRTVRFWEPGSETAWSTIPVPARLWRLVWSQDGRYLASSEPNRACWVWDLVQGRQRTMFYSHMGPVRAVAFTSPDINLITAVEDGSVQVWDMGSGQCIRNWRGFALAVHAIAWSPDSARIVSGGSDGLVTVWESERQAPLQELGGHKKLIWSVSWSPDGRWLASCSDDGTIRIWDAAAGVIERVLTGAALTDAQLFTVAWSPDSERLAVASHRQGVLVYELSAQTFRRVGRSDVPPRTRCVEWSPDGGRLVASNDEGEILVWDAGDYYMRARLEGHRGAVVAMAWSADGTRLASASWGDRDHHLLIWDTGSWERLRALDDPNELVFSVAWSADGNRLVSAGNDGVLRWWDPQSGQCLRSQPGHEGLVNSLRLSPDGRLLASCGNDGAIRLWEAVSGEPVETLRRDRPYERLDITGIKGLTEAQKLTLRMLGAVEQ
jgi:WD40 repeat protein